MNSFRVIDTRFRILKGGKIGLSLSISLMAGIMILGSTEANAKDFFNGITDGTTYSSGDISATAKSDTGISTDNYSATNLPSENIIFKPERVKSSYVGVQDYEVSGSSPNQSSVLQGGAGIITGTSQNIADGSYTYTGLDAYNNTVDITATNYDKAYYQTFTPSTDFTVTLDSNAIVNSIIKDPSKYYSVNNTGTYTVQNDSYKVNLIFSGSNTVSGTTSIGDGNIKLNGNVSFGGTVNAGSIDVDTTNTITFNSKVDLSAGTTDAMNFSQAGIVLLSDDFTGNVTSSADGLGTLTVIGNSGGKEQTITGNIGTSTSSDINVLNIGSNTVPSNYSKTVVTGNVFANSTVLNNNGTTNSSTLYLSNGSNITSTITTADANMGILTLAGSSTITGTVGLTGKLAEVNSGATGSSSTFTSTVNAVNVTNTGSGTTIFKDDVTATTVNVNAGTTNFEKNLTATSTNITTGTGNFNTASGSTNSNIVFSGAGTANLYGDLTGNIVTTSDNLDTVTFMGDAAGKAQTINGNIGSSITTDVNVLNIGESGVSSKYSTVTVNGDIFAKSTVLNNGATASSELILADGKNITSTITTADANMGILNLLRTSTVSGQVGTDLKKLANVNAGANGSTGTFNSDVYATNLNVIGTGTVDLKGSYKGDNLNYNADGSVNLSDTKNITAAVTTSTNNTGTLNLLGTSTVSGQVGTDLKKLANVNAGANGSTGTFNSDVYATNLNVIGTGTVDLKGSYKGDNLNYNADGSVNLSDTKNITAAVTTSTNNTGTLNLLGTSTVSGQVGTDLKKLANVNAGADGKIGTFNSDVYATNLNVIGTGTVDLKGSYKGDNLNYNADGSVNLSDTKNITAAVTTSTNNTGTLNLLGTSTVSGQVGTDSKKLANVNAGADGKIGTFNSDVYATNLNVIGTGTVDLKGSYKGDNLNYNADGSVNLSDTKNITAAVTTSTNNTGTLNLLGTSTVSGQVGTDSKKLANVNAGADGKIGTFNSDVYATNLNVIGTGTVNLDGSYKGDNLTFNNDGTVILANDKNIDSIIKTDNHGTGNLELSGNSTISKAVGEDGKSLNNITAGAAGKVSTFEDNVFALNTNVSSGEIKFEKDLTGNIIALTSNNGVVTFVGDVSGKTQNINGSIGDINTLNIGENGTNKYVTTNVNGNINATSTVLNNGTTNSSELKLSDGFNINSIVTTSTNSQGILTFLGDSIASGLIGTDTEKLAQINAADDGKTVRFNSSLNTDNLNFIGDGTIVLADNSNINAPIATNPNEGTLTFEGNSNVSGQVGDATNKLKEINANGIAGKTVTFEKDVYATNTNIGAGTVDFNTISGNTNSNIVFADTGTANLNGNLIGNIDFKGKDAVVNVANGKGILGSVQTLATNNTGILNYEGNGTIDGNIGSIGLGIRELNINTNNQQNSGGTGVVVGYDALARELYADVVNLRNNATLTLKDNVNLINTGTDNNIIKVDVGNTGKITFLGDSNIEGEVGESTKAVNIINAGAAGKTVTFDDMVYATNLKYSDAGTVVLNGDTTSNTAEGMVGIIDFDAKAGTLVIGDDVNIAAKPLGTQFANANDATLAFNGNSMMNEVLGGNTVGNSTFKEIQAGKDNKTVTFNDDVYALEKLLVSENGIVNLKGNLHSDLLFAQNGLVNVDDTKTIKRSIKTQNDSQGNLNFKGSTALSGEIGTDNKRLNSVKFASEGTGAYTQSLGNNIYAVNTTIGNGINNNTITFDKDITFGGNLDVKDNSTLNIKDSRIIVKDNLNIVDNSKLNFKVYTTDLSAGQAVENGKSGNINTSSLTMASDAKINIDYDGTWEGAGKYNLITSSSSTGSYSGTEANGLVKDNSIIDSVVKFDGTNLTLFADRTGGSSFNANDLYIETSQIGQDYSNGASQALAGYANQKKREGALADIIRDLEYLEGGRVVSEAKKQEMIKTQRLLTPTVNGSNLQTSITASDLALSSINGRLGDVRRIGLSGFSPDYTGLSSGDTDIGYDSTLWMKAMGSKATQSSVARYDGYDTSTYGFVAGMDKTIDDDALYGIALAYSTTKTNQDNLASDSSDTKSIQATAYASKQFENAYVDGYLSYSQHKTDGTRTANSGKVTSSVKSDQIGAKVEAGYNIPLNDGISVTPFASVEYGLINQKAYNEKGSKYQNDALKVDAVKLNKGTVALGAKLTTNIEFDDVLITPEFKASVYNSFGDNKSDIKAQFMGGGDKFVTPVQELNKTMYNIGMAVETKISDSTSLIFGVDYDRSKDGKFQAYSGNVTFGISF